MQLSLHSDYALRVLIYLGSHPGKTVSTREISQGYGISRHHLVRVVQTLGEHGFVELLPGRSGGVRLAQDPNRIRLGDVVMKAEPNLRLVECFDAATNTCPIISCCGLRSLLKGALDEFLRSLNQHTLAELLTPSRRSTLAATFIQLRRLEPAAGRATRREPTPRGKASAD
ncbi:MAG: Rrf2 family transcriptional regulator [Vicinamibacterales bacterium]